MLACTAGCVAPSSCHHCARALQQKWLPPLPVTESGHLPTLPCIPCPPACPSPHPRRLCDAAGALGAGAGGGARLCRRRLPRAVRAAHGRRRAVAGRLWRRARQAAGACGGGASAVRRPGACVPRDAAAADCRQGCAPRFSFLLHAPSCFLCSLCFVGFRRHRRVVLVRLHPAAG